MAITAAICNSFKQEILQGVHASGDTYNIALYTSTATLDKTVTSYAEGTPANEVAAAGGYAHGGIALSGFSVTLSGDTAVLDWTVDPAWGPGATITARGALIYNASKTNKAVCVLNFSTDQTCTNGTFTVKLPTPDSSTGLVRIA